MSGDAELRKIAEDAVREFLHPEPPSLHKVAEMAWSKPGADVIGDVRRNCVFILSSWPEHQRPQTWGPWAMWFREADGTVMTVEEGIRRYGPTEAV